MYRFDVEKLEKILAYGIDGANSACPINFWFNGVECAQVAADCFAVLVVIIDTNNVARSIVPVSGKIRKGAPLVLQLRGYHYNLVILKEDCVYPMISEVYEKISLDTKRLTTKIKKHLEIEEYSNIPVIENDANSAFIVE